MIVKFVVRRGEADLCFFTTGLNTKDVLEVLELDINDMLTLEGKIEELHKKYYNITHSIKIYKIDGRKINGFDNFSKSEKLFHVVFNDDLHEQMFVLGHLLIPGVHHTRRFEDKHIKELNSKGLVKITPNEVYPGYSLIEITEKGKDVFESNKKYCVYD